MITVTTKWLMGKNVSKIINHEYSFFNISLQYDSNTTKILFMAPRPLPPTAFNLPKVHAYYVSYTHCKQTKTAGSKYIKTKQKNNFNCITTYNNHPVDWEKNWTSLKPKKHAEVNIVVGLKTKYVKSKQSTACVKMSNKEEEKKGGGGNETERCSSNTVV